MNTQSNNFVQEFSFLFKRIKEDDNLPPLFEDESIYDAVVGFNTVKFLIEHGWSEDEDKACEVILQECDKMKKTEQKLESKLKEKLKDYIEGGVEEVSIYGNHASITLENDKKEFKISEFLNGDFCRDNKISGFSTLHGDGKSGMHGFVAEEGKRKIRHYVVTDGSYEMTLNWYVNGEKCTIKINIDKDGVDLIERNGVTKKQLEANKDVKISGLFLHEIEFGKKEKAKENEVESSFETTIRRDVSADITREKEDNSHFDNSRRQSYDSGIGENCDYGIDPQNRKTSSPVPPRPHYACYDNYVDLSDEGSDTQSRENSNRSSQEPKVGYLDDMLFEGINDPASCLKPQKIGGLRRSEQTLDNQQKDATTIPRSDSGNDYGFPPSDPSTFIKSLDYQGDGQKDERYDNPTFTTFGYTASGRKETVTEEALQIKSAVLAPPIQEDAKELGNTGDKQPLNDVASILAWREERGEIELSRSESEYGEELCTKGNEKRGNDEQKEIGGKLQENGSLEDSLTDVKTVAASADSGNDSGYSSPITDRHESQVNPEQLKERLTNVKQNDGTEFTSKLDKETQTFPLRPVDQKGMSAQTKELLSEAGLLKDSLTDAKTNDSGYSSPICSNHKQSKLEKLSRELKKPAQNEENVPKDLFSEQVLEKIKEGKQYDPIRKWLQDKISGQSDITIAVTELCTALSELCTEAQKGFVEREEERKTSKKHGIGGIV